MLVFCSFVPTKQYKSLSIAFLITYFGTLFVAFHDLIALFGFFIFITITNQIISGTMLAFSFLADPMLVPLVRDEEDLEDLYCDDFFWTHERGVDLLFIFLFLHLMRKLFLNLNDLEQEYSWKSGIALFLLIQVVVFMGLVLCCTHLSEITLTIAANALQTFFCFIGKPYWWVFTDQLLNVDTLLRISYGHYTLAFFLFYLGISHGVDMHYDWKFENNFDAIKQELCWWDEVLAAEVGKFLDMLLIIGILCFFLYTEPEAISYEFFMWGDIGAIIDIRFYGVAPHWYFRPYMAWLIACPFHRIGLFGLVFFMIILYYQFYISGYAEYTPYVTLKLIFYVILNLQKSVIISRWERTTVELDFYYQVCFGILILAMGYTLSFLPYGRFYNRLGGNLVALLSFLYIFIYLGSLIFRYSIWLKLYQLCW